MIESLGGPIIATILFLMPMYAIKRVPAMAKYQGQISNVFVATMGLIAISAILINWSAKPSQRYRRASICPAPPTARQISSAGLSSL